jgi:hypothetical protein
VAFGLPPLPPISAYQIFSDKYDKIYKKTNRSVGGMSWDNEYPFLLCIFSGAFYDVNRQGYCYGILDIRKYSNRILPLLSCNTPRDGTYSIDSIVVLAQLPDGDVDNDFYDTAHPEKHYQNE